MIFPGFALRYYKKAEQGNIIINSLHLPVGQMADQKDFAAGKCTDMLYLLQSAALHNQQSHSPPAFDWQLPLASSATLCYHLFNPVNCGCLTDPRAR